MRRKNIFEIWIWKIANFIQLFALKSKGDPKFALIGGSNGHTCPHCEKQTYAKIERQKKRYVFETEHVCFNEGCPVYGRPYRYFQSLDRQYYEKPLPTDKIKYRHTDPKLGFTNKDSIVIIEEFPSVYPVKRPMSKVVSR